MIRKLFCLIQAYLFTLTLSASIVINDASGWFESGHITWQPIEGAYTYHVYYSAEDGEFVPLDKELIRNYGNYGRADVLGIKEGNYRFKIVGTDSLGNEMLETTSESELFTVKAHDRGGFAHLNYQGIGAYNDDGTLKEGAKVLYVTGETAQTVTCDVVTNSKGEKQTFTGLQTIIDARQKGYDTTPLAIRIIGTITAADMDKFSSSAEGLQIKGKKAYSEMNITLEGVGNDATIYGFGILVRNCTSIEIRNLGIMLCMDDCISFDTDNSHCWVHNIDFFYGQTGGDSDQEKGDGSLDCKADSKYMTFSYNRFWDSGKMALCGMTSETSENFITYHHNWFDHSDSRHPRVRTMTVHVYNNYFDGISKYGIGATTGSNIFVENNYFRNTNRPMLISLQGTDVASGKGTFSGESGGMIKAFGNVFTEKSSNFKLVTHKESATQFDCYAANSRNEQVPSTYTTVSGGHAYNNFDIDDAKMYAYTAHEASEIPNIVTGQYGAGRMQHGDFKWTYDNSIDDSNYDISNAMKSAIEDYQSTLIGNFGSTGEGEEDIPGEDEEEPNPDEDTPTTPSDGDYSCHFTDKKPSNDFYSVVGNYSTTKGTATVNETTYTTCLKMESSTTVTFNTTSAMQLMLVFAEGSTPNVKINGNKIASTGGNIIYHNLEAGEQIITKADVNNLFYINLSSIETLIHPNTDRSNNICYDLSGRIASSPIRDIHIEGNKKVLTHL